jgi:beta-glucanase (GH16 family)
VPVVLLVAVVLVVASTAGLSATRGSRLVPQPVGVPGPWLSSWHDEFDGRSLDRETWQPHRYTPETGDLPFNPSLEDAWFSPRNVHVRDGLLELHLQPEPRTLDGRRYPYSSGVVQATASHRITPGTYVEARVRVPTCSGCWPAFWAIPADRWPPEIDVFEYFDTAEQERPTFNYHLPGGGQSGPSEYGRQTVDHRTGFHVYGLLWTPTAAIPHVDGVGHPGAGASSDMTSLPLGLILNLSLETGSATARATMAVDWVRVWRPAGRGTAHDAVALGLPPGAEPARDQAARRAGSRRWK